MVAEASSLASSDFEVDRNISLSHTRMQLPPTDDMPAVRTHRFDTTMYAHILSPDVSSKLAANDKDAALCAVSRAPQRGEARFCWVSVVTSDTREASGELL